MDIFVTRSTYWNSLDCLLSLLHVTTSSNFKSNHFFMVTSVSVRPPKAFSEPPNTFLSAPKLLEVDLSGYNFSAMVLLAVVMVLGSFYAP